MKPGNIVAFVDAGGFVHDAEVVSVISDGKAATSALTLRTLDDGVVRSNVQHAEDRPSPADIRVLHEHISAGHWREATKDETTRFTGHAKRRADARVALAKVDGTPKKDETPEQTRVRVATERSAILTAAAEPPVVLDETPWVGETPAQTTKRIADAKAAQAAAAK